MTHRNRPPVRAGLACALLSLLCLRAAPPSQAAAPRLTVNTGHHAAVQFIAYSPDGTLLAVRDKIETRLWEAATGRLVMTLPLGGLLGRVSFSSDGELIAGDADGGVAVYELKTGRLSATLARVRRPTFGAAGRSLFVLRGVTIELLEAPDYKTAATFRPADDSLAGDFNVSPDGRLLASAHNDSVKLWDVAERRELRVVARHPAPVRWVEFSADARLLATCGEDGTARVWDVATGVELHRLRLAPRGTFSNVFYAVTFSPDGRRVATAGLFGAHLWEVDDGSLRRELAGGGNRTDALRFSPDGKTLAGGSFRELRLWSGDGATPARVTAPGAGAVRWLAFAPDGSRLYASGDALAVWTLAGATRVEFMAGGHSLSLSRDAKLLARGADQGVALSDAVTGKKIETEAAGKLAQLGFARLPLAVSPDGRSVVVPEKAFSAGAAALFSTATGAKLADFEGHADATGKAVFSADGRVLASFASKTVKVHDTKTGKTLRTFAAGEEFASFQDVALSPDGALLAAASHLDKLKVWRLADGAFVKAFDGSDSAESVVFSPDGKLVAAGMRDGSVKVWRTADGSLAHAFAARAGEVTAVAFHPGGRLLASGAADGRVRLWNLAANAPLAELVVVGEREWVVAAPDNRFEPSPGAEQFLHWADGLKLAPLGAHPELRTPNLLRDLLRATENN